MRRTLTISLDEHIYEELQRKVGNRDVSEFIEELIRPHVVRDDLEAAYAEMAQDEEREREALEWSEAMIGDVADAPR